MDTPEAKPAAPFQFGVRALLLLTTGVAIVCSIGVWMGWTQLLLVLVVLGFDVAYMLAYLSMKGWAKRDSLAGILIRLMLLALLTAVLAVALILSIPFLLKLAA